MGFYLGSLFIAWYGVIIAASILLAFTVGFMLAKRHGYNTDVAFHLVLIVVPMAILGARVLYVITNPGLRFFAIRDGGLAIIGGLVFAIISLLVYCRIRKVGFFTLCDFIVVGLILAQAVGRWGNFTSQEVYGWRVDSGFFPFVVNINGSMHLAIFFYDFVLNLIGFGVLYWFFTKKQTKWGTTSALYFIWYGTVRAILEPFRYPSYTLTFVSGNYMIFNRVSFVLSLLLIIYGCVILVASKKGWLNQENKVLYKKEGVKDGGERNPEAV